MTFEDHGFPQFLLFFFTSFNERNHVKLSTGYSATFFLDIFILTESLEIYSRYNSVFSFMYDCLSAGKELYAKLVLREHNLSFWNQEKYPSHIMLILGSFANVCSDLNFRFLSHVAEGKQSSTVMQNIPRFSKINLY